MWLANNGPIRFSAGLSLSKELPHFFFGTLDNPSDRGPASIRRHSVGSS
jgi:hypothetical protein